MRHHFALVWVCLLAAFTTLRGQDFREVTQAAGIQSVAIDPDLMAGGVAWLDYNNDRYPDLVLTNGIAATRLFRNNWDGTFTDVSERSGLNNVAGTMGVVGGDFDGDGFTDLFVSTMNGLPNRLLRNNGEGNFVDVSQSAGITANSYGASVTTADYDGDGDLDIYVTNYLAGTLFEEGGLPNFLYRNDGNFRFTEVAAALGLDDQGCGLGAIFSDFNGDGRPDLYVANDFGYAIEPNAFFQNDFPFFTRQENSNGTAATINAMGVAKGDYDNDGDQDLYITNIRENVLFTNTGAGNFFTFNSFFAGVELTDLTGWGTSFADFNLNGYPDLFVANGEVAELTNQAQEQRFFTNNGDGTFTDASESSGVASVVTMGRGLAVADYDLDGYPDVAINAVQPDYTGGEQFRLLHNDGDSAGLWFSVETPVSALSLRLHAGENTWYREVDGGSSYLSHSSGPVHFGAPPAAPAIDSLVVFFTDRPAQTYTGLSWNELTGVRPGGSWYRIDHARRTVCAEAPAAPVLNSQWQVDAAGRETLLLERTATTPFAVLEEQIVSLRSGELYRGLARTQDAMFVDTIAGQGPCPDLQPIQLRILEALSEPVVYPNPVTSDQLKIQLPPGEGDLEVVLLNVSGAVVLKSFLPLADNQGTVSIALPPIPGGVYILQLGFASQITYHKLVRP